METHPQKAEDMPTGSADLSALVRTIEPILDQLIDGAFKGALHADDLVDIAVRIRTILHDAVARQHAGGEEAAVAFSPAANRPGGRQGSSATRGGASATSGSAADDAALISGTGG